MADPGAGQVRYNNATVGSVTAIAIDDITAEGTDVESYLLTWDDGTASPKGYIYFKSNLNSTSTATIFAVNSLTDNAGWVELAVTYISGVLPSGSQQLVVDLNKTGNIGPIGPTGPTGPTDANNLFGGGTGQIPYQTAAGATAFDADLTWDATTNRLTVNTVQIGRGNAGDNTTTAVGRNALNAVTSGVQNTAVGALALEDANGTNNVAVGFSAALNAAVGDNNVAVGANALFTSASGSSNIAIGANSLYTVTGAGGNVAIGDSALYTIGNQADNNIAIGFFAGYDLTGNVDGNVLLGNFTGNADGLDISTSTNTVTVSNGAGNVRLHYTANGNFVTKIHTASTTLWANNFLEIFATSNTSLTFRYRGSDGTTRSASITLS
jgi:hypothetical protein